MNAASLSRIFAKAGYRPLPSGTPRTREGIRVTRNSCCIATVMVDHDTPNSAARVSKELEGITNGAGFKVDRSDDIRFTVNI